MAGSRTLKLSILADVDDLKKELNTGSKEVEGFGGKLEKFSAAAKAAFLAAAAAAAAYAAKLAVDGVKAAIEDEAAQKRLALALKNVTDATDEQIKAVEQQILKTSLATGVADDKLRPALQRLSIATGSVEKSQELLNLALDISAATGKDVETVTNALAKAYEGNNSTLTRLGVGITAADAKTLGFEGTVKQLSETFGGAAATQANTFEGRIARLKVAFDEAKESVGAALLPIIEKLLKFITETAIPAFEKFKQNAIDPVIKAFKDNEQAIRGLYNFAKDTLVPFLSFTLLNSLKGLSTVASTIVKAVSLSLQALEPIINAAITGINAVIRAKNLLSSGPDTPTISKVNFSSGGINTGSNTVNPGSLPFGGGSVGGGSTGGGKGTSGGGNLIGGGTTGGAGGGSSIGGTIAGVIAGTNAAFDAFNNARTGGAINGVFDPGSFRKTENAGLTINVNSPSIIDEEGFTRAVVLALNNSTNRGTTGAGDLRTNAQIL
jgi:hypothetical protein